jgi:WD40 repeat protein
MSALRLAVLILCSALLPHARAELFVSSHDNSQIFRFQEITLDFIDVFVPNTNGRLQAPHGLAFGPDGNLYVSSAGNDRVLRYHGQTGAYIDDFIPTGAGGLDYPVALIFRGTNLYVSSQLNDRVLRYNATTGAFIDTFVTASAALDGPSDMTFGPDGNLYVVGRFNNTVVRFDGQTGAFVDTYINTNLQQPFGLRFLDSGLLLVASGNQNRVQQFDYLQGNTPGRFLGSYITNNLTFPIGIVLAPRFVVVANYTGNSLCVYDGVTTRTVTAPNLRGPNFMAFRPSPQPTLSIRLVDGEFEVFWPNSPSPDFHVTMSEQVDGFPSSFSGMAPSIPVNGTNSERFPMTPQRSLLFFRLKKEY